MGERYLAPLRRLILECNEPREHALQTDELYLTGGFPHFNTSQRHNQQKSSGFDHFLSVTTEHL